VNVAVPKPGGYDEALALNNGRRLGESWHFDPSARADGAYAAIVDQDCAIRDGRVSRRRINLGVNQGEVRAKTEFARNSCPEEKQQEQDADSHVSNIRIEARDCSRREPRANGQELEDFSLHQVGLLVAHVIVGVAEDCFLVFLIQVAAECSWGAHPEGIWFDDCLLGDQGAGGDDGAGTDDGAVEDDHAHADKAASFDGASVEDRAVAHGDVVANVDAILFLHAVEDGVVLNVGVVANADLVDVAAEHGVHPDAGVFPYDHVADELGGVVDIASFGELGGDAFVGANHGLLSCSLSCEQKTYHGAIAGVRLLIIDKRLNHREHKG